MGPPDGPSGPREFEWAHVIQTELNSWDPSCLSPHFRPRPRLRAAGVLRPLPVALLVVIMVVLAATALAAGPRTLSTVIGTLTTRPKPSATPVTPHASRVVRTGSPNSASGAASGATTGTPAASPSASSASQPARSAAPAAQSQPEGGGSSPGSQGAPQQVQLPTQPQQSQLPQMPPLPTPALPHLPPPPLLPQAPPVQGGGVPTPGHGTGPPPTPGLPITHPAPGPTNGAQAPQHPTGHGVKHA